MSIPVTTIGLKISVATEQTAGTRPTTGFKHLPKITSFPEFDLSPDTLDTTSYDNLKYKSSTPGLIDTTGAQVMEAIYTEELKDIWDTIAKAYNADTESGKGVWLAVQLPGNTNAWYFPIEPMELGVPNLPLADVVKINVQFTLAGDIVFETAPTYEGEA